MTGLTFRDDFERLVVDWLDETAGTAAPDYLDESLERIEHVRQRPAWLSTGRWIPMRALTVWRFELPRFAPYLALLGLLLLIAFAIALVAGSQRPAPPPFGLAAPGWLVLDAGGDLVRIDVTGTAVEPLTKTPEREFGATWSRDGRYLAYWRAFVGEPAPSDAWTSPTRAALWIAEANGRNARPVADPLFAPLNFELYPAASWSPDSRMLALSTSDGGLFVVDAVTLSHRRLGGDEMGRCCPAWSPDGSLIAFNGGSPRSVSTPGGQDGVFVVRPDGSGEERISTARPSLPLVDWSVDGRLVYTVGSGEIAVSARGPGGWSESIIGETRNRESFFPRWSNRGDRIAYVQDDGLWVAEADGSNASRLALNDWAHVSAPCWSPDDRTLVVFHTDVPGQFVEFQESASALFVDVAADEQITKVPVPRTSGILACSWQRLAP